jgi:hypothetical protein
MAILIILIHLIGLKSYHLHYHYLKFVLICYHTNSPNTNILFALNLIWQEKLKLVNLMIKSRSLKVFKWFSNN